MICGSTVRGNISIQGSVGLCTSVIGTVRLILRVGARVSYTSYDRLVKADGFLKLLLIGIASGVMGCLYSVSNMTFETMRI